MTALKFDFIWLFSGLFDNFNVKFQKLVFLIIGIHRWNMMNVSEIKYFLKMVPKNQQSSIQDVRKWYKKVFYESPACRLRL